MQNPAQCIVLCRDPNYTVLLEMTLREFGYTPKLTVSLERVEELSMNAPTLAWFIDLDGQPLSVRDISLLAQRFAPDAKIIFLSSQFTKELAVQCMRQKALSLLAKPVSIPRLAETISSLRMEMELMEGEEWRFPDASPQVAEKFGGTMDPDRYADHAFLKVLHLTCPVCQHRFDALRFRLGSFPVTDTDTDFCPICPESVHPELYSVMVCQSCLFACYVGKFEDVRLDPGVCTEFLRAAQQYDRTTISMNLGFAGERLLMHGIKSFELAAYACQKLKIKGYFKLAGEYYLKGSWLCRRLGHPQQEKIFQEKALECFQKQYEPYLTFGGSYPSKTTIAAKMNAGLEDLNERGVVVTGFLAGELARRLGQMKKARLYYQEVLKLPFFQKFTSLVHHINAAKRLLPAEAPPKKPDPEPGWFS